MSVRDQFGGGSFGGGRGFQNVKIKDLIAKSLSFRIFPAMHSLREKNQCSYFHKRHFGYKGESFKDPGKAFPKPFVCIERTDRDGMVTCNCAECRNIDRHTEMLNDAIIAVQKAAQKSGVMDSKKIDAMVDADEIVRQQRAWLRDHNLDKKVFFAVLLSDNALAILEMGTTARDNLKTACDEVRKKWKKEPISDFDQGAWFSPTCSAPGQQNNVTTFSPVTEEVGEGAQKLKLAPLSEDVLKRALETLPDLTDAGLTFLSAEQIKALVECDGDPSTVDTIMGMSQPRPPKTAAPAEPTPPETGQHVAGHPPPTTADAPAEPDADNDEVAALQRQLEEALAKKKSQKSATHSTERSAPLEPAPTESTPSRTAGLDPKLPRSREEFRNLFADPRPHTQQGP